MDNVETGLSVKVIEEVDEPTGLLVHLVRGRHGKSLARGKSMFFFDRSIDRSIKRERQSI
jgi:hypothetical protein